jgi:GNAT superfamily N-acetyltransferase
MASFAYRLATEADLPECERLWREGLNGYLGRFGFPEMPLENPSLRRLHAHTLATDPSRFCVGGRTDGPLEGFGSAVQRGSVWFLSMLFVSPAAQGRGLGRGLLERLLPDPGSDSVLATATDSAQPISNALYASLGIIPRMPLFNLVGRPAQGFEPEPLPAGSTSRPFGEAGSDREDLEIAELDREILGYAHPEDHAYIRRESRLGFAYRDAAGRLQGYGYASPAGRVGPIAVRQPELLGPILGHVLTAVIPRGASSVWLPGSADGAVLAALRSGLRIEGFPTLVCWSRPFADFGRYVPISPGLV